MLGKHAYVGKYFNANELEHITIGNIVLQQIRMNLSVRYQEGNNKAGFVHTIRPLNEGQEITNQ